MEVELLVISKINRFFDVLGLDLCLFYFKNIVIFFLDVFKLFIYIIFKVNNKVLVVVFGKVLLNLFLFMKFVSYEELSLI